MWHFSLQDSLCRQIPCSYSWHELCLVPAQGPDYLTHYSLNCSHSWVKEVGRFMNGKTLKLVVLTASIVLFVFFGFSEKKVKANFQGPLPGLTGAPGESTCSSCHAGGPTGGVLTIEGLPDNYTSGQQITVTVRLNHPGRPRFGFELTVLGSNGQSAGTIELIEPQRTQLINSVFGPPRVYIEHTATGTSPSSGQGLWQFRWTAPAASTGACDILRGGKLCEW